MIGADLRECVVANFSASCSIFSCSAPNLQVDSPSGYSTKMSSLPLAGIRVIDFGRFIAGPYCAMLLADMGADVIRIDRRQGSEDRYTGPVTEDGEGGA